MQDSNLPDSLDLHQKDISKLQQIQNSAAHLILLKRRRRNSLDQRISVTRFILSGDLRTQKTKTEIRNVTRD